MYNIAFLIGFAQDVEGLVQGDRLFLHTVAQQIGSVMMEVAEIGVAVQVPNVLKAIEGLRHVKTTAVLMSSTTH